MTDPFSGQGLGRMFPGSLGGQSRVATPIDPLRVGGPRKKHPSQATATGVQSVNASGVSDFVIVDAGWGAGTPVVALLFTESATTVSGPAGWTLAASSGTGGAAATLWKYTATASPPFSHTFTSDRAAGSVASGFAVGIYGSRIETVTVGTANSTAYTASASAAGGVHHDLIVIAAQINSYQPTSTPAAGQTLIVASSVGSFPDANSFSAMYAKDFYGFGPFSTAIASASASVLGPATPYQVAFGVLLALAYY